MSGNDPMGVVEYGDADEISDAQASALLDALIALDVRNPRFKGWGPYRAEALTAPNLRPVVSELIMSKDTGFSLFAPGNRLCDNFMDRKVGAHGRNRLYQRFDASRSCLS